jgi:inhibitor of cysteine peptidase
MTRSLRQKTVAIVAGLLIMAALLAASGCTQQSAPATTPAPAPVPVTTMPATMPTASEEKKMVTFTESDNGATKEIVAESRFAIQLKENPTTGYTWNATTSPGLEILSSDFKENAHPEGMVGVGGIRTWVLKTSDSGNYTFTASYARSWEAASGNGTGYSLTVSAVRI